MKEEILRRVPASAYLMSKWWHYAIFHNRSFKLQQKRRRFENANGYSFRPFDETQSIFVHIPKCAGISVSEAIYGNLSGGHTTLTEYATVFRPEELQRYFKFTFVRNPWDRVVSAFHFLRSGGFQESDKSFFDRELSSYAEFPQFVRHWLNRENIWKWEHFRPQYYYMTEKRGKIDVDFVGFVENIESDFAFVCKRLGKVSVLPHMNAGSHSDFREYYDGKTRQIVADVYREDICLLNYDFDNDNISKLTNDRSGMCYSLTWPPHPNVGL